MARPVRAAFLTPRYQRKATPLMNRHSAAPPARNHMARAIVEVLGVMQKRHESNVVENVVFGPAMSMFWMSPGRYETVVTATGYILYRHVPELNPFTMPAAGEVAKAIARTRAYTAEGSSQTRPEDLWAR